MIGNRRSRGAESAGDRVAGRVETGASSNPSFDANDVVIDGIIEVQLKVHLMSETWVERTSAFDRVKGVSLTLSEPRTAAWIGEEARVSENTARNHLARLAELGVLTTAVTDRGRAYAPDPIYTRSQDLRDLLRAHDEDGLAAEAVALQEELESHREAYDADTPEQLRASVADAALDVAEARARLEVASDWEYARYRLSLVRDALEHYDTYTSPSSSAPA